jgi:hypothetical protein
MDDITVQLKDGISDAKLSNQDLRAVTQFPDIQGYQPLEIYKQTCAIYDSVRVLMTTVVY